MLFIFATYSTQEINLDKNPVALSEEFRNIMCDREEHMHPTYTLMIEMIKMLCLYVQKGDESNKMSKKSSYSLWAALE